MGVSGSDGAGHVLATAQRRLDLSMTVGALRYLDCTAVGLGQRVVFEGCIAVGAGGVDGHVALGAGVGSHLILRLLIPRLGRGRDKCSTGSQPGGVGGLPPCAHGLQKTQCLGRTRGGYEDMVVVKARNHIGADAVGRQFAGDCGSEPHSV